MAEIMVQGISASPGIVMGRVFRFENRALDYSHEKIGEDRVEGEVRRFLRGRQLAYEQLVRVQERAAVNLGEGEAEIIKGHLEILMDGDLEGAIRARIRESLYVAEMIIGEVFEENARELDELDYPYMKERAADLRDIGRRVQYAVAGVELLSPDSLEGKVILIAEDLTPSDTALMDKTRILGFATEKGGVTSHVAIMAKSLGLPAVVGAGGLLSSCPEGADEMILDGSSGIILFSPEEETRREYEEKMGLMERNNRELAGLRDLPAVTLDGRRVELCANIGSEGEMEGALRHGAQGIGLFRTEFLFMDKPGVPSEEEQFAAYRNVVQAMDGKGVNIRTLDMGGDKEIPSLDREKEENPFLGWRAIRMCLDLPEFFTVQLRAILRASHYGKLRILYPLIVSLEETRRLNALLEGVKESLRSEGIPFDEEIEVGLMIETPAAALIASSLVREVDFFSIGTNDLTQYTLAVDRGNERIAGLYQPLHPAVLSLIARVIGVSHGAGKRTGLCGELGGNGRAALLLVGMGLDEFSMSPASIGRVKNLIRKSRYEDLKNLAARVLEAGETAEVEGILDEYMLGLA